MVRCTPWILALAACRPVAAPPPPSHRVAAPVPIDAAPARQTVIVTSTDECGLVVDMVYFPERSVTISSTSSAVLDQTADMFRCLQNEGKQITWEVRGHTDATEPDPLARSDARAHEIAAALVGRGVAAATLVPRGYGAAQPLDRRSTPEAHAKNRRVDFLIIHRGRGP